MVAVSRSASTLMVVTSVCVEMGLSLEQTEEHAMVN